MRTTIKKASMAAALGVAMAASPAALSWSQDAQTVRFGNHYEPAHPNNSCGAELMQKLVNDADVGLSLTVYPAAQLGTAPQMIEQLAIGELEMAMGSPADLGAWYSDMSVLDAAYAFDDFGQVQEFLDTPEAEQLFQGVLDAANARILGVWLYGTRHVTANKPLRTPADLEGLRIRAPDAPIMLANVEAMGGRATPMAFGEVYLGLQQGIIDAQENPLPSIQTMKFNEVQDYLMLTGHMVATTLIMVSEPYWQGLSEEQQNALKAAAEQAADPVRKCIEQQEQEILAKWQETGEMTVVDDLDLDAFRKRAQEFFSDASRFPWAPIYQSLRN